MGAGCWFLIFCCGAGVLLYNYASISVWSLSTFIGLILFSYFAHTSLLVIVIWWLVLLIIEAPLAIKPWRRNIFSRPALKAFRKIMPAMSRTEKEALNSGTIGWEGELFSGAPCWEKLLNYSVPALSEEEQAFLNGPVEELCRMIDDWNIVHERADLPPEMWTYIKRQGFFGLIIPKKFGGKEFSALAHSSILVKISGRSPTVASTVSVPNSLGPAELLLHYGTDEQKNFYLPRLATGEEIPCFALTGPEAGSDASAMRDYGIICEGEYAGQQIKGIKLYWEKRYITLAPIATVLGLAFKLYDPEHLLGEVVDLGITCALIPTHHSGVNIGRRHAPIGTPFQNGPTHGEGVFIPLDWIIGGPKMAGHGWQMLMECLATGRAISLPSNTIGGAKIAALASGAYAQIRKQFNVSIGHFEGIEAALARIATQTYIMDATRVFTAAAIDSGDRPAVASAIAKYQVTERGRQVLMDAMDIHGGKGICMGPRNYLAHAYQSSPIAITVEGANILTRCMIVFGQGIVRCHPYVREEIQALEESDPVQSLQKFDAAIFGHVGFTLSNFLRTLFLGVTGGCLVLAPRGLTRRYFQQLTRYSAAFALISDVCMFAFGGALKRKEGLSSRLADIVSSMYLLSAVLKRFKDHGMPANDFPIIQWCAEDLFYTIQERLYEITSNLPPKFWGLGLFMRCVIFPCGRLLHKPNDMLSNQVAQLLMTPSETRSRLSADCYLTADKNNVVGRMEVALLKIIAAEPLEKRLDLAIKAHLISGYTFKEQIAQAIEAEVLTKHEAKQLSDAHDARIDVITVDHFDPKELTH